MILQNQSAHKNMTIQTTKCPNCHTVFRVNDEQLEKAEGTVRCSQCSEIFNALAFLPTENSPPDSGFDSVESDTEADSFAKTMEDVQDDSQDFTIPEELNEEPRQNGALSEIINALKDETKENDIPIALQEDLSAQQTPKKNTHPIFWGFCSLILISTLTLQYAYFSREKLSEDPSLRPWLTTMCEYLQCNIPHKKDLSLIHLLSRDVLIAPTNNKDALVIQLSFINKAEHTQPFPVIQIYLSDTYGKATAMRRFKPDVYLDPSVDIKQGLETLTPVNITLELLKPEKEASAFQIDFL